MKNCKCKSLTNDSYNGALQLAVLQFWTSYTVWYFEQKALQKLDLFLLATKNCVLQNGVSARTIDVLHRVNERTDNLLVGIVCVHYESSNAMAIVEINVIAQA
jgi:hypothetical protein